jgi:tetratricopeptide (TPR) repeat protein
MRGFSFALGVRCEFCHVGEHDAPNGREDFAADQKPEKVTARAMLVMTKRLNEELLAKIPNRGTPPVEVTCVTCHHGQPKPQTLSGRLHAAMAAAGVDSAIAEVRHLHDNAEYGWFDLSEWGISEAAREFSTEGKNDEALALLHLNAEYNPQSTAIPAMMAEVQVARGDRAAAIEILHKLLAADPENRRAKRMLEQLEAPPKEGKQ